MEVCKFCEGKYKRTGSNQKFCSISCQEKSRYRRCLKERRAQAHKCYKKLMSTNPEKRRKYANNYYKKYYKLDKNKERRKIKDAKSYKKNKRNWCCRAHTRNLINRKESFLEKKCKKCKSEKELEIHHEVYPKGKIKIIEAVKQGKIYYLCHKHHRIKY